VRISARTVSIIALPAIVLIGAIGWGSYSLYRIEKQRRLIRNARTSLEKHASEDAWFWASQALRNRQDGVEEARLMVDIVQSARSPDAIFWRARVVSLEPKLLQNYLAWADTSLVLGDLVAARIALDAAPKEAQLNASWHSKILVWVGQPRSETVRRLMFFIRITDRPTPRFRMRRVGAIASSLPVRP
jgi:hypothetical protein